MRRIWLTLLFFGLGCQSPPIVRPGQPAKTPADDAPQMTLKEMEAKALKEATELLAQRQEAVACGVLDGFLTKYPERCDARLAYADLLLQMKQTAHARTQFEELIEHCQEIRPEKLSMLMKAHAQLTDIARGQIDPYGEHLHQGIGLYLMARNFAEVGVGQTHISKEKILEKAGGELNRAHATKLEEAQPCWYLHCVYRDLGQQEEAERFLRMTRECSGNSRLTREERRQLQAALKSLANAKGR